MVFLIDWESHILRNKVLLIPAAGKGSRSNLNYPKSLFKVKNRPILTRILSKFKKIKHINKCIVINKDSKKLFENELNKNNHNVEIIFQQKQNGMGDAILSFENSKYYKKAEDIIVIWGDMPFLKLKSIKIMLKKHEYNNNDFTLITTMTKKPYTLVKRNKYNQITRIIETKENKVNVRYGEKDIGLFIFNKKKIFNLLKKNLPNMYSKTSKEHGFLYLINHMYKLKYRVEGLCIAENKEGISFNQMNDIKKFL